MMKLMLYSGIALVLIAIARWVTVKERAYRQHQRWMVDHRRREWAHSLEPEKPHWNWDKIKDQEIERRGRLKETG